MTNHACTRQNSFLWRGLPPRHLLQAGSSRSLDAYGNSAAMPLEEVAEHKHAEEVAASNVEPALSLFPPSTR
jgi:hypothetical protein